METTIQFGQLSCPQCEEKTLTLELLGEDYGKARNPVLVIRPGEKGPEVQHEGIDWDHQQEEIIYMTTGGPLDRFLIRCPCGFNPGSFNSHEIITRSKSLQDMQESLREIAKG